MTEVTRVLNLIQQGDLQAEDQLLPLVYDAQDDIAGTDVFDRVGDEPTMPRLVEVLTALNDW